MKILISVATHDKIVNANQSLLQSQKDLANIVGGLVEGAGGDPTKRYSTNIDKEGEQWFVAINFEEEIKS